MMDKWFDVVNSGYQKDKNFKRDRLPVFTSDDERLVWLERDFIGYLDEWRASAYSRILPEGADKSLMMLSTQTDEGLRIATKSIVAITRLCLDMGAEFVIPRRINQDPLEAYFGYQRQKVSRGDTPSVSLFSATARSAEVFRLPVGKIKGANVAFE